jgi:hypothetical protein
MVKKLWYANPRNKYPFRNDSVKMSKGVFEKNAHGSNFGSPLCSIDDNPFNKNNYATFSYNGKNNI